jgi:nitrogen fixation/metabolism regulation signal transduction histidine kinase
MTNAYRRAPGWVLAIVKKIVEEHFRVSIDFDDAPDGGNSGTHRSSILKALGRIEG